MSGDKSKKWWKKPETIIGVLTIAAGGLQLFAKKHTVAYKVGALLGIGLSVFGTSKAFKKSELPGGLKDKPIKVKF